MFSYIQILCASLVAVTITAEIAENNQESDKGIGGPVNYEFGYNVYDPNSEDIKSHHEIREGKNVYGFYTFKEADGSVRVVKYKVGPTTGFEATVEKLKPGQKIVIRKPDPEDESGQGTGYVEETVQNDINTNVIPQYVGGGSRSQYVLGIINNPLQDLPVQNDVHEQPVQGQPPRGQGYQQAPIAAPAYGQRRNNIRDNRHRNQYVAPTSVRGNRGYGYGQQQIHGHKQGYRQPHAYIQAPAVVHRNQYPKYPKEVQSYTQRPARIRGGTRKNQGYVNVQEQIQANVRNNGQVQDLEYIPEAQVVDQGYAVAEEAEVQESVEEDNNAEVKDEGEQEAEDDEFDEFKADLEDEDDEEQADEEEVAQLEEDEGEEETVEVATEAQQKTST